jgi:hypothetical protein
MKYLTTYKLFESTDLKFGDRDKTNYHQNKDIYLLIKEAFGIDCYDIGYIFQDLVEKCDVVYQCDMARDKTYSLIQFTANTISAPKTSTIEWLSDKLGVKYQDTNQIGKWNQGVNNECRVKNKSQIMESLEDTLQEIDSRLSDFNLTLKKDTFIPGINSTFYCYLTDKEFNLYIVKK